MCIYADIHLPRFCPLSYMTASWNSSALTQQLPKSNSNTIFHQNWNYFEVGAS